MKSYLKSLIPPILLPAIQTLAGRNPIRLTGTHGDWESAVRASDGYASDDIFNKAVAAAAAVFAGDASYERDTVVFDEIEFHYPVLAHLGKTALSAPDVFRVVDIGGGFGSSYHQFRKFFTDLHGYHWTIVEQPRFAAYGQAHFANQNLSFVDSLASAPAADIALYSASLQYLESPASTLGELARLNVNHLLIDMVPITDDDRDFITVQQVRPPIYTASYPLRIFSRRSFTQMLADAGFTISDEYDSLPFPQLSKFNAEYRGYYLERIPP